MKKLALIILALLGCGPNSDNGTLDPREGADGRCVFRYPRGSNTPTQTYENVVSVELDPFNSEALTLTVADGSTAVVNGFGSVHCYSYANPPVEG